MKNPSTPLIIYLLTVIQALYGQTDFRPGYYITNDNDTVHGLIDYRGDVRTSKICVFRLDKNNEPVRFRPGEILGYRFERGKFYISRQVPINEEERLVFAEYLVNGIADLYYVRGEERDHYYIESGDGVLHELANPEILVKQDGKLFQPNTYEYIGVLKATFADCPDIQPTINSMILSQKSLIKITESYHDYVCEEEKCIIYRKEIPPVRVGFGPSFGFASADLQLLQRKLYESFDFSSGLAPSFELSFYMEFPRINEKLSLQVESDLFRSSFYSYYEEVQPYGTSHIYQANANAKVLRSTITIRYSFPTGRFKPFLGAGPMVNYLYNTDFWYTTETSLRILRHEDDPITALLVGALASAGIDIGIAGKITAFCNLRYCWTTGFDTEITILRILSLNTGIWF
jgi:hypothetical protein